METVLKPAMLGGIYVGNLNIKQRGTYLRRLRHCNHSILYATMLFVLCVHHKNTLHEKCGYVLQITVIRGQQRDTATYRRAGAGTMIDE